MEEDHWADVTDNYLTDKIKSAKMPKNVHKVAEKELSRITQAYKADEAKTAEWLNSKETNIKLNISESVPLNDVKNIND